MDKFKNIALVFLLASIYLVFHYSSAQASENNVVLLFNSSQDTIELHEKKSSEYILDLIPNNTNVTLLEYDDEWSFIQYNNETGYVLSEYVFFETENNKSIQNDEKQTDYQEEPPLTEEIKPNQKQNTQPEKNEHIEQNANPKNSTLQTTNVQQQLKGVALKQPTHVYSQTSTNSKVLKSYNQGHILLFQPHNSNWYSATVIINGQRYSGFIHADDVDIINQEQKRLNGFAIRYVEVYASPTRNANILKGYRQGHKLIYRTFSSQWYEATVYVNGIAHTGYIHASDVANEPPQDSSQRLKGVAKKTSTPVYSSRSTASTVLKTYNEGHILIFRNYDNNWYEATVYLNGTAHTGYIYKNDVEVATLTQQQLQGISNAKPTRVFASATKKGQTLKSYQQGLILKYRTFTPSWYEATVYISGKRHTGYIYVNDVETAYAAFATLNGIAKKKTVHVYNHPSTSEKVLKSYPEASKLKYRTFTPSWYEATVYVNGKRHTGYIHKNDVETIVNNQQRVDGFAAQNRTKVYSKPSKSSSVLKTYAFGSKLILRTFTNSWYEATVYVNGKRYTGYFHKDDVSVFNGKVIVIDAGHGGNDTGAVGNGLREKDITLDIALRVKQLLEEKGFAVIMTRDSDVYPSLKERTDLANNANADIFVSIHVNAGGGTGIETWWHDKAPEPQKRQLLATYIQNELIAATGAKNRGVKSPTGKIGNFHVTRETKMPSVLVEVGFIDNASDAAKLAQSSYRQQIAKGIVEGIIKYFTS